MTEGLFILGRTYIIGRTYIFYKPFIHENKGARVSVS